MCTPGSENVEECVDGEILNDETLKRVGDKSVVVKKGCKKKVHKKEEIGGEVVREGMIGKDVMGILSVGAREYE